MITAMKAKKKKIAEAESPRSGALIPSGKKQMKYISEISYKCDYSLYLQTVLQPN